MSDIEAQKKPEKKKMSKLWIILILVVITGGTVGGVLGGLLGGGGGWIKGKWVSNFGASVIITDDHWISVASWGTSVYAIDHLTSSYVIMQNPSSDNYNPDKWTKNEFHRTVGDDWGFCSTVYNAATAQTAVDTDTSAIYTATDADAGCNGFPHTMLSPATLPITGEWSTNFGASLTITDNQWTSVASYGTSVYSILYYGSTFVIMQNPSDAAYNPDKWTKVEFHASSTGSVADGFGFCMSVYDGATANAALIADTTAIYDNTNATAGCNTFSHTIAMPA